MIIFVKIKFLSHLLKYDSKNFRSGQNFSFQIIACKIFYNLSRKNVTIYYVMITFCAFYDFKKFKNLQSEIWPCSTPTQNFSFFDEVFFALSFELYIGGVGGGAFLLQAFYDFEIFRNSEKFLEKKIFFFENCHKF